MGATLRYKLRYEAVPDLIGLLNAAEQNRYPLKNVNMVVPTAGHQNEVLFDSNLSVEGVRPLCGLVDDGHVMQETVTLEADYTGERRPAHGV